MFEEDHPLPGFRTNTESYVFWQLVALATFSSWAFGGNIVWAPPFIIAIGIVGSIFYFMHGSFGHGHHNPLKVYFKSLIPLWCAIAITIVGLNHYPFQTLSVGDEEVFSLIANQWYMPVNAVPISCWVPLLLKGAMLIAAFNIVYITESHYMLRRLIMLLLGNAIVLALVGYIVQLMGAHKILGFMTPVHERFFSVFTHPDHWGAFALLWSIVALGIIAHLRRRHTWQVILAHRGVWLITGILILVSTLFVVPSPLYRWLFCVALGGGLIHKACFRYKHKARGLSGRLYALMFGLAGIVLAGGMTFHYFQTVTQESLAIHVQTLPTTERTLTWGLRWALYQDAWQAFLAKPLFGWGAGSFGHVIGYFQNADISQYHFNSAHSDLLETLVENGIVGTVLWWVVPIYYLFKFSKLKFQRMLSYYLFAACLVGVLISLIDFPFQNPAFTVSFWIILFCGYRWSATATFGTPIPGVKNPAPVFTEQERRSVPKRMLQPVPKKPTPPKEEEE